MLLTTAVMVTWVPATVVAAEEVLTTCRSAVPMAPTVTMAVAELLARLGSEVPETTFATSTICEPPAAKAFTVTLRLKVEEELLATSGLVQLMVPVAPTARVVQVQPATAGNERNVVLAGMVSEKTPLTASSGPLLVTTWVYMIVPPGATTGGVPTLVTARSAEPQ